ncbi:MAG: hypothetical protein NTW57_05405 [Methylophilales bacterium]|jgi:hypothetical protein|nr:hypothetical protein [Methylophilales bacterium]
MKYLAVVVALLGQFSFSNWAFADAPSKEATEIPTVEKEFIDAINGFDKAQIIAQFGEPAKADDVKIKGTGKIVASIWQYHFINTSPDGSYYETTELDFIDDKVVTVVFLNNDGSDIDNSAEKFEVPTAKPKS